MKTLFICLTLLLSACAKPGQIQSTPAPATPPSTATETPILVTNVKCEMFGGCGIAVDMTVQECGYTFTLGGPKALYDEGSLLNGVQTLPNGCYVDIENELSAVGH